VAFNPLDALTNDELWNSQLLLLLTCGRSHSPLRQKRRAYLCSLATLLKNEADHRGLPSPSAPYHPGDLKA